MNLQGKVAVITGASGGIGSVTARRFAEAGCKVVVGYNSRAAEAEKVVASLPGSGHRVARMPMEDTAALRDVAAMVEREYGRCDVLVNSAGFTRMIPHVGSGSADRRTDRRDLRRQCPRPVRHHPCVRPVDEAVG